MAEYPLVNASIYAALGLLIFFAAFAVLRKIVPADVWKQVLEERNVALAVLIGLVSVGFAIIIAATMH